MKHIKLENLSAHEPFPGWQGKFVSSGSMTFVYWDIRAGLALPEHSHPHEQVAHGIEGQFELVVDGHSQVLSAGSVAVIPPHAVHSGRAITDCRLMDAFCPIREDYLAWEN